MLPPTPSFLVVVDDIAVVAIKADLGGFRDDREFSLIYSASEPLCGGGSGVVGVICCCK